MTAASPTQNERSWGQVPKLVFVMMTMVAVFSIAQGLSYPLLAKRLEVMGYGSFAIGVSAFMTPLGLLISGMTVSWVVKRIGARRWGYISGFILAVSFLLIALIQDYWLWLFLRFLIGIAIATQFMVSETWMISITPKAVRGRVIGLYNFMFAIAFSLGPLLLGLFGTSSLLPFGIAVFLALTPTILIILLYNQLPTWNDESTSDASPFSVLPSMLFIALVVVCVGGIDQITMTFFAPFLEARGFSENSSYYLLWLVLKSGALFMLILGWLMEKTSRNLIWFSLLLGGTILPLVTLLAPLGSWLVIGLALLWGMCIMPLFVICMVEIGEKFEGASLLAANAVFSLGWGLGGMILPPATGFVIEYIHADGFAWTSSALTLVVFLAFIAKIARARKGSKLTAK